MLHDGCIRSRHICTRRFNVYNIHIHGRSVITTYVSFLVLPCLLRDICVTLPGKAQQPQKQCYPFLSVWYFPASKQWYGCQCWGFVTHAQMLMRVMAHKGLHWKLTRGEKSLAASGTRTRISIAPGLSVSCSTHWAIPATHSSLVRHITNAVCWAQNGSTHGHAFTTSKPFFFFKRGQKLS